jgi:hypothetical protein
LRAPQSWAGPSSRTPSRARRGRARIGCTPWGTRTSTRRGCGRCVRPSARWRGRSRTSST